MRHIGIGCTTYRGHKRVANLLDSIRFRDPGVDRGKLDIVVHDDGSPGGIPRETYLGIYELLDIGVGNILVTGTTANQGIAPSWNLITDNLFERGADMVILLNDDIIVVDDWIRPMEYFLDNNPKAGAASWGFMWFDPIDVSELLTDPNRVCPRTHDSNDKDLDGNRRKIIRWEPGNARPGRLGAPSGCCFAFSKTMWELSNKFPAQYKSFHEESNYGFSLCKKGHPSFGLTYPLLWHQWSATFNECPELKAAETMTNSRQLFCKDFGVPPSLSSRPFDYVHPRVCSNIPEMPITWISKNGVQSSTSPVCGCQLCEDYRKNPVG